MMLFALECTVLVAFTESASETLAARLPVVSPEALEANGRRGNNPYPLIHGKVPLLALHLLPGIVLAFRQLGTHCLEPFGARLLRPIRALDAQAGPKAAALSA